MKDLEQFSALLHSIYAGATNPSAWPDIVAGVSEWMGSDKGLLITSTLVLEKGGFAYTYRIPQSSITLWSTRYADQNLWTNTMVERGLMRTGLVLMGSELVPDEKMFASEWYQHLLAPDDILQLLFGLVYGADHPDIPFVGMCSFRSRHSSRFNEEDRSKMRLLLPHLSRSLGVMFKLRDAEFRVAASLHALNQIRTGIVLLDHDTQVCFANAEAERICRLQDGLRLKVGSQSRSALRADDSVAQAALQHAFRTAVGMSANDVEHFAHTIGVQRRSGLPSFSVQVSALPESNPYQQGSNVPRAIVFIKDGAQEQSIDASLLIRTYGLTLAEARLAAALCNGGSLESVAQELKASVNTLKSQLKSVYAKTSVNSRAALTKLLLSLGSY
jgi:DNA-binding CsgD family transcriptional regulator/PAS domain-containing protein